MTTLSLTVEVAPKQARTYFTVPFQVPEGVATLTLRYRYERRPAVLTPTSGGVFTARPEVNVIDLGLIAPDGSQVGASGSDKTEITVSATRATPGYRPTPIVAGEWRILVGAYKVAPEGVTIKYEIVFTVKQRRLFLGDLHTHTLASDGVHTAHELAIKARRHGLDFVAITDHNQTIARAALPQVDGVTLIPGIEWTHYAGHANFLGSERPYDGVFATQALSDVQARFASARERGALIVVNHPLDESCPFTFDLATLSFDALEVWNGPMREANLRAVGLWQQWLSAGRRVPIVGGSDYHRDTPFIFLGGPTTGVYADSEGEADILAAVRAGRSFLTFAPNGPTVALSAGDAGLGEVAPWPRVKTLRIVAGGLASGDVVRVVTAVGATALFTAPEAGDVALDYLVEAPGFARIEILRVFIPGVPPLPALLSNPIYFEATSNENHPGAAEP
ncbi:MAG TPA: CehA/McbA family metallohydrolase [Anaerolineales bacterium]|nr:CehA/McbA family metallohydrolase [Anaerolineales bacterium]